MRVSYKRQNELRHFSSSLRTMIWLRTTRLTGTQSLRKTFEAAIGASLRLEPECETQPLLVFHREEKVQEWVINGIRNSA